MSKSRYLLPPNLPELPQEWEWKPLGELLVEERGICYGIVQPERHDPHGVPMINSGDILNNSPSPNITFKVSKILHEKFQRSTLRGGEILLTLVGANFGRVAVAPKEYAGYNCSRAVGVIPVVSDAEYIAYALQTPLVRYYMDNWANTTAQPTFNLGDVTNLPVAWPPQSHREVIRRTIDSLDKKVQLNTQTNQTLEQIAQAIFKSWFVDFDPAKAKIAALGAGGTQEAAELAAMCVISGKDEAQLAQLKIQDADAYQQLAQTAALFPAAMQESELGEVPTGWDILKIESVLQRLSVKNRYTKTDVETYGQIPVFEQGVGILLGYHNNQAEVQASPENPAFIFGDHTCVMHLACRPFDVSANVIALRGNKYPTIWTYYAILGKQQFQEYRRHWSELAVKELIAPQDTALAFAFENLIKNNVLLRQERLKESSSLSNLRDSLLPKLLSGEIDVAEIAFKNE